MDKNRYLFIINPKAGKKHGDIPALIKRHSPVKNAEISIKFTECAGHAEKLAADGVKQGFGNVIAAGGDGTIQETAKGIFGADVRFGMLPCGSGNGLARNMSVPLDIDLAADGVFKWQTSSADAGFANGNLFLVSCGAGLDAEVAHVFNSQSHGRGILPYVWHALRIYFSYKPKTFNAVVDGKKMDLKGLVLTAMIGEQYGGGAKIAPLAVSDDGYLDLCVVRPMNTLRLLSYLPILFSGKIHKHSGVYEDIRCREFSLEYPEPFWFHLDGEDFFAENGRLSVKIAPGAFKIIRP